MSGRSREKESKARRKAASRPQGAPGRAGGPQERARGGDAAGEQAQIRSAPARGERNERRGAAKGPAHPAGAGEWLLVGGRHPVLEALAAGAEIREVLVAEGARGSVIEEIERAAAQRGIEVRRLPRPEIDKMAPLDVHQGVLAYVRPVPYAPLDALLERARAAGPGLLLVLDGIEDPHNLGALIRTCDAAGAHGVIIGKHRAAGLTEAAIKASAGAAYYVPVARVANIAQTLELLKEEGYWTIGASPRGDRLLWDVDFTTPTAIVIGGEGKGLSRLVEERCDLRVRLPMAGAVSSLNASVAGALFLYEAVRQRQLRMLSTYS